MQASATQRFHLITCESRPCPLASVDLRLWYCASSLRIDPRHALFFLGVAHWLGLQFPSRETLNTPLHSFLLEMKEERDEKQSIEKAHSNKLHIIKTNSNNNNTT